MAELVQAVPMHNRGKIGFYDMEHSERLRDAVPHLTRAVANTYCPMGVYLRSDGQPPDCIGQVSGSETNRYW